ncbi:MAG: hypothetical protein A2X54_04015 [Nitrospirae bacterium GWF2_44_13]|nr:MAG: hypothetical protein A2X54_04015 [Nitrospirae bacterium GWF2_44_13]OGW64302.1 MAG: hypothetical protein A2222_02715 [Nitrospirae bacterium RIFOXYA2_FULL_44_9]
MLKIFISAILSLFLFSNLYAAQSTIIESEGYACMGEDKSMKETERTAMVDAKDKAAKNAATYIKGETKVKDSQLVKDIIEAYNNATVAVDKVIKKGWYTDPSLGKCYKVKIKANVIPDEKAMQKVSGVLDDPSVPLSVKVWTDKKEYREGDKIKIYIKGNKPFYAKVIYKETTGSLIQILPNPYRKDNYFNGGVIYEVPSGNDRFELEVNPPFGEESIAVYTSTSQLGDLDLKEEGGVYQVKTKPKDIGIKTRSVKIKEVTEGKAQQASEFFEDKAVVKTGK